MPGPEHEALKKAVEAARKAHKQLAALEPETVEELAQHEQNQMQGSPQAGQR